MNLYLGGKTASSYLYDILEFDPQTEQWSFLGRMMQVRGDHAVSVINFESDLCDLMIIEQVILIRLNIFQIIFLEDSNICVIVYLLLVTIKYQKLITSKAMPNKIRFRYLHIEHNKRKFIKPSQHNEKIYTLTKIVSLNCILINF